LQPGFASQELHGFKLMAWRDAKKAVLRWSGLTRPESDDQSPRLVLDRNAPAKEQAKLTVRWTTDPVDLAAGSVDYRIAVIAGEDVLAELTISHRDNRVQQAVFGLEDFEELSKATRSSMRSSRSPPLAGKTLRGSTARRSHLSSVRLPRP